jgi:hypothetical protein
MLVLVCLSLLTTTTGVCGTANVLITSVVTRALTRVITRVCGTVNFVSGTVNFVSGTVNFVCGIATVVITTTCLFSTGSVFGS